MSDATSQYLPNDLIFQLDYAPNSRMIDKRGEWTSRLAEHFGWQDWGINENQISSFKKDQSEVAQVGYRRCGFLRWNNENPSAFPALVRRFLLLLFSFDGFGPSIKVERIGVRAQFFTPCALTFDDLLKSIRRKVGDVTKETLAAIGTEATLIDIGYPAYFKTEHGTISTHLGAATRKEAKAKYFPMRPEDQLPEVGVYFDADYFYRPEADEASMDVEKILAKTDLFSQDTWKMNLRMRRLVVG